MVSRGSFRAMPSLPTPSVPKQQLPRKDPVPIDQPNTSETSPVVQVSPAPPTSQTEKPSGLTMTGTSVPNPYHQPQVSMQFGGPNQPIPSQGVTAPQVQQTVFEPSLQSHPMPHQGIMHQGPNLSFTSQMAQMPPPLDNLGISMAPQYSQQPGGKFSAPRKTPVKITNPKTNEEVRFDIPFPELSWTKSTTAKKLETSGNGEHAHNDKDGNKNTIKKYSRDFLLKFSEQYTNVPEDFEITADIAVVLKNPNVNASHLVDHNSFPRPGRIIDTLSGPPRLDLRGSGMIDDYQRNKLKGFVPNAGFGPGRVGSLRILRNQRGVSTSVSSLPSQTSEHDKQDINSLEVSSEHNSLQSVGLVEQGRQEFVLEETAKSIVIPPLETTRGVMDEPGSCCTEPDMAGDKVFESSAAETSSGMDAPPNLDEQKRDQPGGKFSARRKTPVKIINPQTNEEIKFDKYQDGGSSGPRSHPNVPLPSQPTPSFAASPSINYYTTSYNANNLYYATPSSQAPTFGYTGSQETTQNVTTMNPPALSSQPGKKSSSHVHGILELPNLEHARETQNLVSSVPSGTTQVTIKPGAGSVGQKVEKYELPKPSRASAEVSYFHSPRDPEICTDRSLLQPKSGSDSIVSEAVVMTDPSAGTVAALIVEGQVSTSFSSSLAVTHESVPVITSAESRRKETLSRSNSIKDPQKKQVKKGFSQSQHQVGGQSISVSSLPAQTSEHGLSSESGVSETVESNSTLTPLVTNEGMPKATSELLSTTGASSADSSVAKAERITESSRSISFEISGAEAAVDTSGSVSAGSKDKHLPELSRRKSVAQEQQERASMLVVGDISPGSPREDLTAGLVPEIFLGQPAYDQSSAQEQSINYGGRDLRNSGHSLDRSSFTQNTPTEKILPEEHLRDKSRTTTTEFNRDLKTVSQSSNNSGSRWINFHNKKCKCGKNALLRISETKNNPNRLYYCCVNGENDCGFFEWWMPEDSAQPLNMMTEGPYTSEPPLYENQYPKLVQRIVALEANMSVWKTIILLNFVFSIFNIFIVICVLIVVCVLMKM